MLILKGDDIVTSISIVVPVYNVEVYLDRCIKSILSQTHPDLEIILVNDGSTDSSGEICEYYSKIDKRIIVIHKENGGQSSARNTGIDIARGDYIGFVDSDDYVHQTMYKILFDLAINNDSDIVMCDYYELDEIEAEKQKMNDKNLQVDLVKNTTIEHLSNLQALNLLNDTNRGTYAIACNKLFKRHLFNNLRFIEGRIYEDVFLAHRILYRCRKLTYIDLRLYYYIQRQGSTVNSPFTTRKFDKLYAMKDRADFFRKIKEYELNEKAIKHYIDVFFWNYFKAKQELTGVERDLRFLKRTIDKSVFLIITNKLISWKHKVMILLFVFSPSFYELCNKALKITNVR